MSDDADIDDSAFGTDSGIESVPIDGTVIQYAAALGSVGPNEFTDLLVRAQRHLNADYERYDREFECVYRDDERAVYLVPLDHWDSVGAAMSLEGRETKAVRRAHERQLKRVGTGGDRRDEFDTALEIRSAVVVAIE